MTRNESLRKVISVLVTTQKVHVIILLQTTWSHSPGSNGKSCERQVSGYKTWKIREIDWVTVFTIIIIQKDMTQIRTDVKETIST